MFTQCNQWTRTLGNHTGLTTNSHSLPLGMIFIISRQNSPTSWAAVFCILSCFTTIANIHNSWNQQAGVYLAPVSAGCCCRLFCVHIFKAQQSMQSSCWGGFHNPGVSKITLAYSSILNWSSLPWNDPDYLQFCVLLGLFKLDLLVFTSYLSVGFSESCRNVKYLFLTDSTFLLFVSVQIDFTRKV